MKNYLKISDFAETIKTIIPSVSCKRSGRKNKKLNAFVILNSDNDYGFYVRRLVKEINRYPELTEIPKVLRKKSLKNIETGNILVFGDGNDYDYRVVGNANELDHLDGRRFKALDIMNDFGKIIKKLKAYVNDNVCSDEEEYIIIEEKEPKTKTFNVEINIGVPKRSPKYRANIAVLRPEIQAEKVTVFNNWVKVGYNQYDIYLDLFGNEFIYVEGEKFFINKDRYGRKYLVKK